MELKRDVLLVSACLILALGGVLTKSITSLDFESPCPNDWYYIGSQNCAYVIPSDIPTSNLRLFCQEQLDSQLQLIEDKPVCIKGAAVNLLLFGSEGLDSRQLQRRSRLYKRVFGNSGLGR